MTDDDIAATRDTLLRQYPGVHIKVTTDRAEIMAEIEPTRAIAVIERSQPHFHSTTTETYRVLLGTLFVACGGYGHVLGPGESLTINPGCIHYARGADGPAWVEVLSEPPWSPQDHRLL